jgi:ribonuclease HI
MDLNIYTDGACRQNAPTYNNYGGWGAVLLYGEHKKEISGFAKDTTNNIMELTAVIKALETIKKNVPNVTIYTDSKYVCDAFNNNWLSKWQSNGWKTSNKKEVANRSLWERLLSLTQQYNPKFVWVKGHEDNQYNVAADKLAVEEIKKNMKQ